MRFNEIVEEIRFILYLLLVVFIMLIGLSVLVIGTLEIYNSL